MKATRINNRSIIARPRERERERERARERNKDTFLIRRKKCFFVLPRERERERAVFLFFPPKVSRVGERGSLTRSIFVLCIIFPAFGERERERRFKRRHRERESEERAHFRFHASSRTREKVKEQNSDEEIKGNLLRYATRVGW